MTENTGNKNQSSDLKDKPIGAEEKPQNDGPQGIIQNSAPKPETKHRFHRLMISLLLAFVIPSLLGIGYYTFIASDRFAAGASFVIRGLDTGGSTDFVSSFTGMVSGGSTASDGHVVRKFLESPDLLQQLDIALDLRAHYSTPVIDRLSRFNNEQSFEEFADYWQWRIQTTYDSTTGIVTFEVQTFDAATAKKAADMILDRVDYLVNFLSEQARRDSVKFTISEVERSEARLLAAQSAIREFRSKSGSIDPKLNSQLDTQLIAALEAQLANLQSRIAAMSSEVSPEAPMLRQLRLQSSALKDQIQLRRSAVGGNKNSPKDSSTADKLAEFESLQIEQTFAQQRYASALTSLENSRMDADRQQRYLGIFSRPITPEEAIYPQRLRNVLLCIAGFFALWAIGALLTLAVRDHMR